MINLNWNEVSKKAYWDRDVSLDVCREKVISGHRSYLPDAISNFTPVEFIYFLGVEEYKLNWCKMKSYLPEEFLKHTPMYDISWSRLVSGGWNLNPTVDFYDLPQRRRDFLVEESKVQGKSIYQISKQLGMQYKRAYEHAQALILDGKLKTISCVENGRKKTKLYSYKH